MIRRHLIKMNSSVKHVSYTLDFTCKSTQSPFQPLFDDTKYWADKPVAPHFSEHEHNYILYKLWNKNKVLVLNDEQSNIYTTLRTKPMGKQFNKNNNFFNNNYELKEGKYTLTPHYAEKQPTWNTLKREGKEFCEWEHTHKPISCNVSRYFMLSVLYLLCSYDFTFYSG